MTATVGVNTSRHRCDVDSAQFLVKCTDHAKVKAARPVNASPVQLKASGSSWVSTSGRLVSEIRKA